MSAQLHIALLVNPKSGSSEPDRIVQLLRRHGARVLSFEIGSDRAAVASNPDRLVVAGGDGSIGPAASAAARASLPLAVIPAGTANDFARQAEIPLELDEACRLAASGESLRPYDLAWLGDTPFVNVASMGLSVDAATRAAPLKPRLGRFAYPIGGLVAALRSAPTHCEVRVDGDRAFEGRAWQVMLANSGAFGGGAQVEANQDDRELNLTIWRHGPRHHLPRRALGMIAGRIEHQQGVLSTRSHDIEVRAPEAMRFNIDGELVTVGTTVRCRIDANAFELVVPAGSN